ncbi:MAG: hypothetical protein ABI338_02585 [Gemmatimonadaceae bacterium]
MPRESTLQPPATLTSASFSHSSHDAPIDAALAERVPDVPVDVRVRRWVLRDDNHQHYHGVLRPAESPVVIELRWKADATAREQLVGYFRLHLPELLAADFIRFEREQEHGDTVRVRFYRGAGGVVIIQARADRPAIPVGQVRLDENTR